MIADEMIAQLKKKVDQEMKMAETTIPAIIADIKSNHHEKEIWMLNPEEAF